MRPGTISAGVLAGLDGMLFLAGGAHDVLEAATGRRPVDDVSVRAFADNLAQRAARCGAEGAGYLHVVFPDKHTVHPEHFPLATDPLGSRFLPRLDGAVQRLIYDPADDLRALPLTAFSLADTHLTDRATATVAARVAERLAGLSASAVEARLAGSITRVVERAGDLGAKLDPPQIEIVKMFAPSWAVTSLSNNLQGGNNGIIDIHLHEAALLRSRLLVFGDSFSRRLCYALSLAFKEILFCRSPFFHEEVFRQTRPDHVLTANVERYLSRVVSDAQAPEFLHYSALAAGACKPDPGFPSALARLLSADPTAGGRATIDDGAGLPAS